MTDLTEIISSNPKIFQAYPEETELLISIERKNLSNAALPAAIRCANLRESHYINRKRKTRKTIPSPKISIKNQSTINDQ